jgi:hypothetical protein
MTSLQALAESWLQEAHRLRERYALHELAQLSEAHALELKEALKEGKDELLRPADAAAISGYSPRRLRELEAEGQLQNHGRKGAPLYRAGDLPRKVSPDDGFDAAATARWIAGGGGR